MRSSTRSNPMVTCQIQLFSLGVNYSGSNSTRYALFFFFVVVVALDMTSYYETLVTDKVLELDQSLLESMRSKNEEEIKKLDEKLVFLFSPFNFRFLCGC